MNMKQLGYFWYMDKCEQEEKREAASKERARRKEALKAIDREIMNKGYAGKTIPHVEFYLLLLKYNLTDITQTEINKLERGKI